MATAGAGRAAEGGSHATRGFLPLLVISVRFRVRPNRRLRRCNGGSDAARRGGFKAFGLSVRRQSRWKTSSRSSETGLPSGLEYMTSPMCLHHRRHASAVAIASHLSGLPGEVDLGLLAGRRLETHFVSGGSGGAKIANAIGIALRFLVVCRGQRNCDPAEGDSVRGPRGRDQTNFSAPGFAVSVEAATPTRATLSPRVSTIVTPFAPDVAWLRTAARSWDGLMAEVR